ncbi:MAG: MIP/aquaporin family protein [Gemmataceae bacterium]
MTDFLGEFFGTMVLILFGGGVVAGVLLERSKAQNAGWIVVTTGWAFAVMCGIFTSKALGGSGDINPVGPVTELVTGSVATNIALMRIAGEFAGAFTGAVLVWLHYLPHWEETSNADAKLGVFCTAPAIRNVPANFVSEFIGTFALVFIASAIGKFVKAEGAVAPLVGGLVWAIGLSLGGTTGYAINPARDLGPRLAHAILPIPGKRDPDWSYAWIPVVGPFAGGVAAALLFAKLSA